MSQQKNEYLRNWRHRNCTLGELLIQSETNEQNIENVERYSYKEYLTDYNSPRQNIFEKAASSSDKEVPDPDNTELVEEEFVEGNLINDLARWILKYQLSKNIRYDLSTIFRQHGHPEMSYCIRTLPET